jgi:hypothetical protein
VVVGRPSGGVVKKSSGRAKSLAAGQGKTVPGAVLLVAVGRNVPCMPPRPMAGEKHGSRQRRADGP